MSQKKAISNKLIRKLSVTFLLLILLIGTAYILITAWFANKYFEETTQKLNAEIANHLIDEKFQNESPFLENGSVNKPLFGEIMHDMMAVNHGIEVFLLDNDGYLLYSVVLDHNPNEPMQKIDMEPVREFIETNGQKYVLGDDPRNEGNHKIFSAAHFENNGREGYIYIILAGQEFDQVTSSLFTSYFARLGTGATILTLIFVMLLGFLAIWYITKSLREIVFTVCRFSSGDLTARIPNAENTDLSNLAISFNQMADTIVENIEKIKSVDTLRRELIANVSHDLRTPLAIMQGYVETMQMKHTGLSAEEQMKYLNILHSSTEKLSHLVSQLFEYSKLEAKQVEPENEPFLISELAMDINNKYEILAKEKGITINLEIEENLPLVFGDISLVERAIQNLMDNALKFTLKGGTVNLIMNSTKHNVEVSIKDNGPGIPENEQSYIFERYHKAGSAKSSGAGLGLAIVKKILEIHNSTIEVISKPNEGTTFHFLLPVYEKKLGIV
ncbi:MAG: HAMP domain-containing sensor histidine kinase [Cyclobacteriaceae bacterium]